MKSFAISILALALAATSCGGSGGNEGGSGGTSSSSSSSGSTSSNSSSSSSGSTSSSSSSSGSTSSSSSSGSTSSSSSSSGSVVTYGNPYQGGEYHLGPVDYTESVWHNACAPGTKYDPKVQAVEGVLLAGLWNGVPNVAGYCDACIWMVTDEGKSAMLRVVTYGDTTPNSVDVSPQAYGVLDSGEYPRHMTWQFAKCPDTGPMLYEFQTGANEWWTSLWVRNARVPLVKVEVKSANHSSWVELQRGGDGTLTDNGGFGAGPFSIRSTGVDGQEVIQDFPWPSGGIAGAFLTGTKNFN